MWIATLVSAMLAAPGAVWAMGRGAARQQGRRGWLRLRGRACLVLHLAVLAYVVPRLAHLPQAAVTGVEVAAPAPLGPATAVLAASAVRQRTHPSQPEAADPNRNVARQRNST
ncbi:hypothetical protein ABT063_34060 [Streptomyces sp. NPDC002838]|uniref:hypothetical protein n=1 Tax=Streptomyces sp. NPDC002838 TaxID=3154436 RepID=UPI003317B480